MVFEYTASLEFILISNVFVDTEYIIIYTASKYINIEQILFLYRMQQIAKIYLFDAEHNMIRGLLLIDVQI